MSKNKDQAIHDFWSSFGIPAYDENSVPDEATMPYITYSSRTGALGDILTLSGSVWYKSFSWKDISLKKEEIAEKVGKSGYCIKSIEGGYLWITRGMPFAQRMSDPGSDLIRRIYINLNAEFLTAF